MDDLQNEVESESRVAREARKELEVQLKANVAMKETLDRAIKANDCLQQIIELAIGPNVDKKVLKISKRRRISSISSRMTKAPAMRSTERTVLTKSMPTRMARS